MSGVLIDTCIWSLALRGDAPRHAEVAETLARLIDENRAKLIGPIRQELLSGYSDFKQYEQLKSKLAYFPNQNIVDSDYEAAAEYSNLCRRKGVQGSHTDFLICAVAARAFMHIYTADKDFASYEQYLPFKLYENVG